MLQQFRNIGRLAFQLETRKDLQRSGQRENVMKTLLCSFCRMNLTRNVHTTGVPRNENAKVKENEQQGLEENKAIMEQHIKRKNADMFPKHDLYTTLFDGVQFQSLPIVHVKATKNNTLASLADKSQIIFQKSGGTVGYKNSRKGTNMAGHTVGLTLAQTSLKNGYKTVRVVIKGYGPGRMSVLKGLEVGGLNIVSITDRTNDSRLQRPKKLRRL